MEKRTKTRIEIIGNKITTLSTGGTTTVVPTIEKKITKGRYIEPIIPRDNKERIKVAKAEHKEALKNPEEYKKKKDGLISKFVGTIIPKWGTLNIKLINWLDKPRRTSPTY